MRFLLITLLAAFFATPAFGESTYCAMEGPHNCIEQSEDRLVALTHNTIHQMQLTQEQHAFKTQNDVILENAARQHAQLNQPAPSTGFLFWRK